MSFRLENFLPYRLRILYDTITHSFSPIYIKEYGLAPSEWRILASIANEGNVTAKELCVHSRMHKTKVSRAVFVLSEKGLIEKTPNEKDLRQVFLKTSKKGAKIYKELSQRALDFDDDMLSVLSEEEQKSLDHLISKLQTHAQEIYDSKQKEK